MAAQLLCHSLQCRSDLSCQPQAMSGPRQSIWLQRKGQQQQQQQHIHAIKPAVIPKVPHREPTIKACPYVLAR